MFFIASTAFAAHSEIKTTLYLNGKKFDQFAGFKIKIPYNDWQKWIEPTKQGNKYDKHDRPMIHFDDNWIVTLKIKNTSKIAFENPRIKIFFTDNWGTKQINEIRTLKSSLGGGESLNYDIPLNKFEFAGVENTSMSIQIWLDKDENLSADENYWNIWFELEDKPKN